jgi:hypothetical protein
MANLKITFLFSRRIIYSSFSPPSGINAGKHSGGINIRFTRVSPSLVIFPLRIPPFAALRMAAVSPTAKPLK